jgi:hypothetical protein
VGAMILGGWKVSRMLLAGCLNYIDVVGGMAVQTFNISMGYREYIASTYVLALISCKK